MSTLWTPGGERPVPRDPQPSSRPEPGLPSPNGEGEPIDEEQARADMAELRRQLASTPADVVLANHAFGIFELAALHLSLDPPQLDQARLAIDALGALVEGLGDRLGEPATELGTGLAQLRMAYVSVHAAHEARREATPEPPDT